MQPRNAGYSPNFLTAPNSTQLPIGLRLYVTYPFYPRTLWG